MILIVNFKWA